tara:strand:- start:2739 stop:4166 length:1428 start_codon:yes stop_codon:yes gene_type:complete
VIALEKLFQKNDEVYIKLIKATKFFFILLCFYISAILKDNTVYDLVNYKIYSQSSYMYSSYFVTGVYFIFNLFDKKKVFFPKNSSVFLILDFIFLFLSFFIVFSALFILNENLDWYYGGILCFNAIVFLFLNYFFKLFYNSYLIKNNYIQRNVLFIGSELDLITLQNKYIKKNYKSILKACILLDKQKNTYQSHSEIKIPIFHFTDNIFDIMEYHQIGMIWLGNSVNTDIPKDNYFEKIKKLPIDIFLLLKPQNKQIYKKELIQIDENTFEILRSSPFNGMSLFYKFLFDKCISLLILILVSIPLLLIIVLIIIEDGFPFLYFQKRTGWDGRSFYIYKLRTLKKNINFDSRDQVELDDKRVLRVGKFIRRFSIDEIPQFYNVLIGQMSIVGPRPHMVEHTRKYAKLIPKFLVRHSCLPGITGYAQVHGFRGATPQLQNMEDRINNDIWYLQNWSFWLDIKIFIMTFFAVFKYRSH